MNTNKKVKRRGLVMTGGGAKGLYEAGVIHAFHLTNMGFDVITGSSIGAFNSIFFAEYQLQKSKLSPELQEDPARSVEEMDKMIKAYHHAWLQLPEKKIIDDSESGPIGQLKNDLLGLKLCLPDLTRVLWWWTDPDKGSLPPVGIWKSLLKLAKGLVGRVGGMRKLLQIIKNREAGIFHQITRTYLRNFGIERSLIPPQDDHKLTSIFTEPIVPLQSSDLQNGKTTSRSEPNEKIALIAPKRTLRDFTKAGIDVRLTRANYRTGHLEISAYMSVKDFVRYLMKQAFRLEKTDPEKIPLGSFRLQLPGNPDAISAALASGRFPGVLAPFPVKEIYPADDQENTLIHKMLKNWLADADVETAFTEAYKTQFPDLADQQKWAAAYDRWRNLKKMKDFFPKSEDVYVDGGAIDNTPSNSVIDATREWIEESKLSKRDAELDLYIVFLHPEPVVDQDGVNDPALHQVILRTKKIQETARQSNDAVMVNTINTYGRRAEALGDTLTVLMKNYQDHLSTLPSDKKTDILNTLHKTAQDAKLRGYLGKEGEGILERMDEWAEDIIEQKLPIQINKVVIYPEEMPMDTLQFTERLGYRQNNAIKMLTTGCLHTLWAIWVNLGGSRKPLDGRDQAALKLAKTWTGLGNVPDNYDELMDLRKTWKCKRAACVFHEDYCPRGAKAA